MIRKPVAAGRFYSESSDSLTEEVNEFIDKSVQKQDVIGVVSPHAGFIYSGSVAGAVFSRINIPDTVMILGPNHTGYGDTISIMSSGVWEMPNGDVKINSELAGLIKDSSGRVSENETGHMAEHSIEVQIPFIQYVKPTFEIVPITMMFMDFESCREIGECMAGALKKFGKPVLIIASSDMTHYEARRDAEKKDKLAIDNILAMDPKGLYETVKNNSITMCGILPVTAMLTAAIDMGASHAELIKYTDSGEVTHDTKSVVGYAGLLVK